MDYLLLSDILWYLGRIIPTIPIIFSLSNYYTIVSLVLIGLIMTSISRVIDRYKDNKKKFI